MHCGHNSNRPATPDEKGINPTTEGLIKLPWCMHDGHNSGRHGMIQLLFVCQIKRSEEQKPENQIWPSFKFKCL